MSFNLRLASNVLDKSGNLNAVTAGTATGMNSVDMSQVLPNTLHARCQLTAATSTITLALRWQVSNDNSTWEDVLLGGQDVVAALTDLIVTTGTAAIKKVHMSAPDAVYASRYARIAVVVGVTTGAAGDLYDVSYSYQRPNLN